MKENLTTILQEQQSSGLLQWAARQRFIAVGIPVLILFIATVLVFAFERNTERERINSIFQGQTRNIFNGLVENLKFQREIVENLGSLYAIDEAISRKEFNYFVRRSLADYNSIQALEWVPRVSAAERAAYEQTAREEGVGEFQFKQWQSDHSWLSTDQHWAEVYFPVYYVQPYQENESTLGIDLGSNPVIRMALENARDSGQPVVTERIRLAQGSEEQASFLILVPVYKYGVVNQTLQQRRKNLRGYALGVFSINKIFNAVLTKRNTSDLLLKVEDISTPQTKQLLYQTSGFRNGPTDFQYTLFYTIGGRTWQFRFVTADHYIEGLRGEQSWLILIVGSVLTAVIAGVLYALTGQVKVTAQVVKQRTTELSRINERLNKVFEAVPGGLVMVGEDGKIVFVNSAMERLFGYQQQEMIGQPVEMLLPESLREDHPQLRDSFFRQPATRAMGAGRDLAAVCKSGAQFPVEIGLNPVKTSEGMFVLASVVDITGRKKLEDSQKRLNLELVASNEAFEQSIDRLNKVFEAVPSGLIMVDQTGRIVMVNSVMEKLFGYERNELINQPIEILLPEALRRVHPQLRDRFFQEPTTRSMGQGRDLAAMRKNGSQFAVEIGLNPVKTNEGIYVLASVVDITERKKLEEEQRRLNHELLVANDSLVQSVERLNQVFEAVPSGLVMVNQDGKITMVNSVMENLFGYARHELINQPIEILLPEPLRKVHPKLRDSFFLQPATRAMGQGRDLAAVRKNGSQFSVEIGLNPVKTPEGVFVIASVVDITTRKQSIEDQTRLNQELLVSNEALEQSNIELQQFAYVASHDLQAPLRGITGFAQFLQKRYKGKLDETADNYIDRMVDGTKRMQTLINDLLSYSRVESRSRPFQVVVLNEVFEDAVALLNASIEDANATVTRDELPEVQGDKAQLAQLLGNLISNGIKYHGDEPSQVHVSAVKKANEWVVSVKDNGIGIEARQHEKIFEIFSRLHNQKDYPGTGIGLAICRRIVQRHRGQIWVESGEGKGSTFYFSIPERSFNEYDGTGSQQSASRDTVG